ncbi:hypothetical protein ONZ45_g8501 [Pleurotus djamor]|nr:hypothetical protein ONZ45_g8501 [Pleurotus djamor]
MSTEHHAMRVNYHLMGQYVNKNVRIWCKVLRFEGNNAAIVQASDGGEIKVTWSGQPNMTDTYVEVIGTVVDASTIKLMACINMGSNVDLKLANDTVELMHDSRFMQKMFAPL